MHVLRWATAGQWLVLGCCLLLCFGAVIGQANEAVPIFQPPGAPGIDRTSVLQAGTNGNLYWGENKCLVRAPEASPDAPYRLLFPKDLSLPGPGSLFIYFRGSAEERSSTTIQLTVLADATPIAVIETPPPAGIRFNRYLEIAIPSLSGASKPVELEILSQSKAWAGSLLVIPHLQLRQLFVLVLVPVFVLGLLSAACLFADRQSLLLPMIGVIGFLFYYYCNFPAKFLPGQPFDADSCDFIKVFLSPRWTEDMKKHVLLLPTIRSLTHVLSLFISRPLSLLAVLFSGLGAINLMVASTCINKVVKDHFNRGALCAIYGIAFSILVFSSVVETHILSMLVINFTLLASLKMHEAPDRKYFYLTALLSGLLPLATWQLLTFVPFFWCWNIVSWRRGEQPGGSMGLKHVCTSVLVLCIFFAGISFMYQGQHAGYESGVYEVLVKRYETFCSLENLNLSNLMALIEDSFVKALMNYDQLKQTLLDDPATRLPEVITRSVGALCIGTIFIFACLGLPRLLRYSLLPSISFLCCFAVLMGFHWFFRPLGMLFFIPPALFLWFLPMASLAESKMPGPVFKAILIMLLLLQVTTLTLNSYFSMPRSIQVSAEPLKATPIDWRIIVR